MVGQALLSLPQHTEPGAVATCDKASTWPVPTPRWVGISLALAVLVEFPPGRWLREVPGNSARSGRRAPLRLGPTVADAPRHLPHAALAAPSWHWAPRCSAATSRRHCGHMRPRATPSSRATGCSCWPCRPGCCQATWAGVCATGAPPWRLPGCVAERRVRSCWLRRPVAECPVAEPRLAPHLYLRPATAPGGLLSPTARAPACACGALLRPALPLILVAHRGGARTSLRHGRDGGIRVDAQVPAAASAAPLPPGERRWRPPMADQEPAPVPASLRAAGQLGQTAPWS